MVTISARARDALLDGTFKSKYLRISLIDPDGNTYATLGPDNIIKDSFEMTSRLCTEDELKFGLCEGSNISFQTFSLVDPDKVIGYTCKVYLQLVFGSLDYEYIQLGYYVISSVASNAKNNIVKITAYDRLADGTFDVDFSSIVNFDEPDYNTSEHYMYALLKYIREQGIEIDADDGECTNESQSVEVRNLPTQDGWYLNIYYYVVAYKITDCDDSDYYQANVNVHDIFERCMSLCDCHDEVMADGSTFYETACAGTDWRASGCTSIYGSYHSSLSGILQTYNSSAAGWEKTHFNRFISGSGYFYIWMPVYVTKESTQATSVSSAIKSIVDSLGYVALAQLGTIIQIETIDTQLDNMYNSDDDVDITVRDMLSAFLELKCQFGELSRETNHLVFRELETGALYPQTTLYPSDSLYPSGGVETAFPANYQSLLMNPTKQQYLNLNITYSSTSDEKAIYTYAISDSGNINYNMTDNWLLTNDIITYPYDVIEELAQNMAQKMLGLAWYQFELDTFNLCYLEPGDLIELQNRSGNGFNTYILEQQLKGLPLMEDTLYNGSVETF